MKVIWRGHMLIAASWWDLFRSICTSYFQTTHACDVIVFLTKPRVFRGVTLFTASRLGNSVLRIAYAKYLPAVLPTHLHMP